MYLGLYTNSKHVTLVIMFIISVYYSITMRKLLIGI